MHIDPRPEFLGQVLRVTDDSSGEIVEYGIETAKKNDLHRFETASKISFINSVSINERTRNEATKYFSKMLGSAKRIDVYGGFVRRRFPSTCVYHFEENRVPIKGCDPPFNFDYGITRVVVPIRVKNTEHLQRTICDMKQHGMDEEAAHDFPGLTDKESFLRTLDKKACPYIEEDVVNVPFCPKYETTWYPTLRDDGNVGIFQSLRSNKLFFIAESALPYFICDQMIILMKENVEKWTWKQWLHTEEVKRMENISIQAMCVIRERELERLKRSKAQVEIATDRLSTEKMTITHNLLRIDTSSEDVIYDAEILRPSDWHNMKSAVVKIFAREEVECGYALLKNRDCGGGAIEEIIPSVLSVASFAKAEQIVKSLFSKERRSVIVVEILKEIHS